nr:SoxR reducing system RseC family protein [Deinococcus sp. 12RED42]
MDHKTDREYRTSIPCIQRPVAIPEQEVIMSNFTIYMIGIVVLIVALFIAGNAFAWPQSYTLIGAVVLLGLGILAGVTSTKRRDPPAGDPPSGTPPVR